MVNPLQPETYAQAALAVGETVILLHRPLHLVGVSIVMERERQHNDSRQWSGETATAKKYYDRFLLHLNHYADMAKTQHPPHWPPTKYGDWVPAPFPPGLKISGGPKPTKCAPRLVVLNPFEQRWHAHVLWTSNWCTCRTDRIPRHTLTSTRCSSVSRVSALHQHTLFEQLQRLHGNGPLAS